MAYQRSQYPPWSWSTSRNGTFKECKRKYFYNYYLAHNGWESSAEPEVKQAYRLKNLTGLHLLLGSAVHEAAQLICQALNEDKNAILPNEKEVYENVVKKMLHRAWKESSDIITDPNLRKLWESSPKKYLFLNEFYYGLGETVSEIQQDVKNKIGTKIDDKRKACVKNLLNCKSITALKEKSTTVHLVEKMDTFNFFDDENNITPVYAIPDLVYENEAGEYIVVDWKTGSESDSYEKQLAIYALYINDKLGIETELIKADIEYLLTGNVTRVEMKDELIQECTEDIRSSIEKMRTYLEDPGLNKPKEKECFPLRDPSSRILCKWCSFYEMCEKELEG